MGLGHLLINTPGYGKSRPQPGITEPSLPLPALKLQAFTFAAHQLYPPIGKLKEAACTIATQDITLALIVKMESGFHPSAPPGLDLYALFDATPSPYLVLAVDLHIVLVNQAYLYATKRMRTNLLGQHMFEAFPDNSDDPLASGVANLRASFQRVFKNRCADTMAVQKYDIPVAGSSGIYFEERYWSPVNTPILDTAGSVTHVIHCVEDVTEFVKTRDQAARMESKIADQAVEIKVANRRLREANETLEQRVRYEPKHNV